MFHEAKRSSCVLGGERVKVTWRPENRPGGISAGGTTEKNRFHDALVAASREKPDLDRVFAAAASRFGIRMELLKAVARAESGFNPDAVSKAGAQGIMQLMPGTARALGVRNPFDPVENIFAGAAYLRSLLDRFGGNEVLALAAYNAGPGAVERAGGVPPYPETQAYVRRVLEFCGTTAGKAELPVGKQFVKPSPLGVVPPPPPSEDNTKEIREVLGAMALMWRYALTEYMLNAAGEEEKG